MANTNAPFGFRMLGLSGGSVPATFATITRKIASNNTQAIYRGDPVEDITTGYVTQWGVSETTVSRLIGVFDGCKYYSTSQKKVVWSPYWPGADATGDVTAYLIPCIGTTAPSFVVQVASTPLTIADIGSTHAVTIGSGSTLTGMSGAALTSASNTTATLPFTVTGLWSDVAAPNSNGTDNTTNYNWVIVQANVTQVTGLA
jgi:hypothetical protein